MATLSGTFNFNSTISEQIIVDAYERVGTIPSLITSEDILTAQRSLNFLLHEWGNKGWNLWATTEGMLNLIENKNTYQLSQTIKNILTATIRESSRQVGGTPFSSAGGIAVNAFDSNSSTACTQTSADGFISYDYGANSGRSIEMVGIQSNATLTYTLEVEFSQDNVLWTQLLSIPAQSYPVGDNQWFVIPVPTFARFIRIRETGGATLDIQEIFFNTLINDITMTEISESEYTTLPNKNLTGRPSSYYFNRQIAPILKIWPTPNSLFTNLFFTFERVFQDIGTMDNLIEVPDRFFEPLCAGLAVKLAVKRNPERLALLKPLYDEAFNEAAREDSQDVPLRVYGDYKTGWISE